MTKSLADYTKLDPKVIENLILIPSETKAKELFLGYMPLGQNLSKTVKDGTVNALKITLLYSFIEISWNIAFAVSATASAAGAIARATEKAANIAQSSGDRLATFLGWVDSKVKQEESTINPPPIGGEEESNKNQQETPETIPIGELQPFK